MEPILAIDFGTSHTVAVLRGADGRARPLLFDGSPLLRSAVLGTADGQLLAGRDALHMARMEPASFEPNPKRRIDEGSVLLGERAYAVPDLIAAVLHRVATEAQRHAGSIPPVILTHPAEWSEQRRSVLRDAAARAGLRVESMVPEPVAAATYFTAVLGSHIAVGQAIAVFDFGGGTLDVAVVRRTPEGFAVIGNGGLDDLGGLDVDALIVERALARVPEARARLQAPATPKDLRDRGLLWDDARTAKEMLTLASEAAIHVPGADGTRIGRAELDHLATPLLLRAVAATVEVVRAAGLAPRDLAGLFLVGGSSRMPLVAHVLQGELGVPPTVLEQPEIAVAEGAAQPMAPPVAAPVAAPLPRSAWRRRGLVAAAVCLVLALAAGAAYAVGRFRQQPTATGSSPSSGSAAAPTSPRPLDQSIRKFDFKNATWYDSVDKRTVKISNGVLDTGLYGKGGPGDGYRYTIKNTPLYVDADGDGVEEAAAFIQYEVGNGNFMTWHIWRWRNGTAEQVKRPIMHYGRGGDNIEYVKVGEGGFLVKWRLDAHYRRVNPMKGADSPAYTVGLKDGFVVRNKPRLGPVEPCGKELQQTPFTSPTAPVTPRTNPDETSPAVVQAPIRVKKTYVGFDADYRAGPDEEKSGRAVGMEKDGNGTWWVLALMEDEQGTDVCGWIPRSQLK